MHNIKLWSPNNKKTNLHKFINQLDKSLNIKNYADLHNWSIKHKNEFWTKYIPLKPGSSGYSQDPDKIFQEVRKELIKLHNE